MADKKITELPLLPTAYQAGDIFLVVRGDVDYQSTGSQALEYLNTNLAAGAVVTFGTAVPANTSGKDGDVFINTNTNQFIQRVNGAWTILYTINISGAGNTIIYGAVPPVDATGNLNDTYINTATGVFYKKGAVSPYWAQVFSMASGPAGATGAAGANGTNGTNGNTVLHGTTPPSNIGTGVNGDFYINTTNLFIYGPKAAGVWPAGKSIIGNGPKFNQAYPYLVAGVADSRYTYDAVNYTLTFTLSALDKTLFPYDAVNGNLNAEVRKIISATQTKTNKSVEATFTNDGTYYTSVFLEGIMPADLNALTIILS